MAGAIGRVGGCQSTNGSGDEDGYGAGLSSDCCVACVFDDGGEE